MRILAIDPGSEQSAMVLYHTERREIEHRAIQPNDDLVLQLPALRGCADHLAIELDKAYSITFANSQRRFFPQQVLETHFQAGRFVQAWGRTWSRVERRDVRLHLCGTQRARDPQIRQALINRFGPGKKKAIGTKAERGVLYGIRKDLWAALAVAVVWADAMHTLGEELETDGARYG